MAAEGQKGGAKEPKNAVHQNAILVETIMKEQRTGKLYTTYSINPFKKVNYVAGKVNSWEEAEEIAKGGKDRQFTELIKRANQEPTKKYLYPQTTSQEVGWITQPLVELDRSDERLYHPHKNTEMTKFADYAIRINPKSTAVKPDAAAS